MTDPIPAWRAPWARRDVLELLPYTRSPTGTLGRMGRAGDRRDWGKLAHHLVGLRLFLISYAPLGAIAAIQLSDQLQWSLSLNVSAGVVAFWLAFACAVIGAIDAVRLPHLALERNSIRVVFEDIADEGGAVGGYLATYLLPFLGFTVEEWRDLVALGVYAVVLYVVFVRSDLGLVNPTLYLTGHRIVRATRVRNSGPGERVLVLCPAGRMPREAERLAVVAYRDCYIVKETENA